MRQNFLPIALFLFAVMLFSCSVFRPSIEKEGADKLEPYDQFAFQRSFPDRDFNWKGWKNALTQIRMKETALAKISTGCDGNEVNWTEQGPANVGGRCNTLAVKQNDENTVLAGFSGGGIFKSTDGGVNWRPVFDDHLELCISDITFDPSNPDVVYAGTGDPNIPSIVFNGDGVYKSTDAGETWSYLGLSEQGIISKVLVNPNNPQTLVVTAMGNPYVRDEKRGVYKSTDGGHTWQQVLFVSNQAGATDLVQSPTNPNILYASFWDRIRNNHESFVYGPNAKVFKSTDGGSTWTKMEGGLPTGIMGRTGLAISQQDPDKVYVLYIDSLSTPGGLYKTVDGGQNWTSLNINALETSCGDFGWYFGKIRISPTNDEELYFLAIQLYRKLAGSSSWINAAGGHSDSHDLVFTPSGRRYWANDGGVYRNDAGQMMWTKCKNLPITQFYHTTFNPHEPNAYWAGAQDNGIQKGQGGANINNWDQVFSADGFHCAFHPTDPLTFWVEIQNGNINKTTDGGNSWQFGSTALGTNDRVNWDAPFFISRFSAEKLFSATYRVYVSSGSGWGPISPDLTDGIVYAPRFHTISALQESPLLSDKLMAGTSDGNVWRREPTGNWIKINGNLPDRYVTSVQPSLTQIQRLFVTHSGFRDDEYIPHVHRSDDNGASWVDISGDLPQIPVNDLFIMPDHADSVLFVATDAGVYFTKNQGENWSRLGANMPYIPVFDLEVNPVRKQLVAATHARGIWTFPLDSVFAQQPAVTVGLTGTITTENGVGVHDVDLGSVKSNENGVYQKTVPGCSPYTITPFRNDNPLNGLTTYDLVLISKHILGIEPLGSPFKMIAADANRSNSITTFDIVALRKLILGIDNALVGNTSWRFIPKSHHFTDPAVPFAAPIPDKIDGQLLTSAVSNLDFTAVKVGDVNDTAVPDANGELSDRTVGKWPMVAEDVDFQAHQNISILFQGNLTNLAALQFSLQFDTATLVFDALEPMAAGVNTDHFGINRSHQGLLSAALAPEYEGPDEVAPVFQLRFKTKKSGRLSQSLQVANWPTPALAYRDQGTALTPILWETAKGGAVAFAPNPFGSQGTWLTYQAPAQVNNFNGTTLEIFDIQGNTLFSRRLSGTQDLLLGAEIFPLPGVYYWRLSAEGMSGKLVFAP